MRSARTSRSGLRLSHGAPSSADAQARIVELTAAVVDTATTLRASYVLKTPDALQAASALSLGDDVVFVTADLGFARLSGLKALKLQFIT